MKRKIALAATAVIALAIVSVVLWSAGMFRHAGQQGQERRIEWNERDRLSELRFKKSDYEFYKRYSGATKPTFTEDDEAELRELESRVAKRAADKAGSR